MFTKTRHERHEDAIKNDNMLINWTVVIYVTNNLEVIDVLHFAEPVEEVINNSNYRGQTQQIIHIFLYFHYITLLH